MHSRDNTIDDVAQAKALADSIKNKPQDPMDVYKTLGDRSLTLLYDISVGYYQLRQDPVIIGAFFCRLNIPPFNNVRTAKDRVDISTQLEEVCRFLENIESLYLPEIYPNKINSLKCNINTLPESERAALIDSLSSIETSIRTSHNYLTTLRTLNSVTLLNDLLGINTVLRESKDTIDRGFYELNARLNAINQEIERRSVPSNNVWYGATTLFARVTTALFPSTPASSDAANPANGTPRPK